MRLSIELTDREYDLIQFALGNSRHAALKFANTSPGKYERRKWEQSASDHMTIAAKFSAAKES